MRSSCMEFLTLLTPPFRVSSSYFAKHACHYVNVGEVTFCTTRSCRCTALKRCTNGVTSAQNSPSDENAAGFLAKVRDQRLERLRAPSLQHLQRRKLAFHLLPHESRHKQILLAVK